MSQFFTSIFTILIVIFYRVYMLIHSCTIHASYRIGFKYDIARYVEVSLWPASYRPNTHIVSDMRYACHAKLVYCEADTLGYKKKYPISKPSLNKTCRYFFGFFISPVGMENGPSRIVSYSQYASQGKLEKA